jgi:hypothetical protein
MVMTAKEKKQIKTKTKTKKPVEQEWFFTHI